MTPEEYEAAQTKLLRYGEAYDANVDKNLPSEPIKNERGAIAKKQPPFRNRPKAYYQAQCSFRGLRTTGSIEDLQNRLRFRDKSEDTAIKREIDKLKRQLANEDKKKASKNEEAWWNSPARTFAERLRKDPRRALKESLEKEDTLKKSFYMGPACDASHAAATELSLCYQVVNAPQKYRTEPGSGPVLLQVIGQIDAVKSQVAKISAETVKESREIEKQRFTALKAEKAAEKSAAKAAKDAEKAKRMNERKHLAAWDPTGQWKIECLELATHPSGPPKELSMEIFRDDYEILEIREEQVQEESRGLSDMDIDGEEYYGPGYVERNSQIVNGQKAELPRFGAVFDFGVVRGIMRIYPTSNKTNERGEFHIKSNKTFALAWLGRESGKNALRLGSDAPVQQITFANRGTTFKGTFDCQFVKPKLVIKGAKVEPGYGTTGSTAQKWAELS
ncbi:hypothetical protein BU23DRAFT_504780 [Bimuria novae-zelandiae CBS 107.79]|uniref:Uncharacterized protein n=1 Tax=Bimuria novae-zelandiae CBS 107.79 TaxID=1447943 RepID=A0A6A5VDK7_9PLEO|nr:hypothetical protein BU23DRAFT_504780 [Bimuria novae-zelandiae CBS 107.79]